MRRESFVSSRTRRFMASVFTVKGMAGGYSHRTMTMCVSLND
jgi:hypothetical protein